MRNYLFNISDEYIMSLLHNRAFEKEFKKDDNFLYIYIFNGTDLICILLVSKESKSMHNIFLFDNEVTLKIYYECGSKNIEILDTENNEFYDVYDYNFVNGIYNYSNNEEDISITLSSLKNHNKSYLEFMGVSNDTNNISLDKFFNIHNNEFTNNFYWYYMKASDIDKISNPIKNKSYCEFMT